MWLSGILRTLFVIIDSVVFWAIEKVYGLFSAIAETGVFSPEVISTFAGRIYVLLGVFMLFKVSFSLISYILNPDSFSDKKNGMGNLVKRAIIALVGVIAVPYVFQAAYSLQSIILKDNIIGNIILGTEASNIDPEDGDYIKQGGKIMSHTIFTAFIRLNPDVVGDECANNPVIKSGGEYSLNSNCDNGAFEIDIAGGPTVGDLMVESYANHDAGLFLNTDVLSLRAENSDGEVDWVFDYSIVFSTLTGGLLVWILLLFCIDVGVRSVKLGFLQLIAPIPLISYVDPKGEKIFQKWLGECGKTYVDVFVRLVAIYFVVYVIVLLETTGTYSVVTGERQTDIFVNLFIILGALMFAKQLPDLISNILGIKLSGGFTLNPMNKIQQVPLVGSATTNVLGRVAGATEAAIHDQTGNRWRAAASGWFAAGNALHGKVPLMGAKPGSATVRSIHTGRESGYEVATGSKTRAHSFVNDFFQASGQREIDRLKDERKPLQAELTNLGLQKQEVANAYNRLNEQYQKAKTESARQAIYAKMQEAQARYQAISTREAKVSGDIGVINDQIKDLEKAYHIDKSPKKKIDEVEAKVQDNGSGYELSPDAYGTPFEPLDLTVRHKVTPKKVSPSTPTASTNSTGQTRTTASSPTTKKQPVRVTVKPKNTNNN